MTKPEYLRKRAADLRQRGKCADCGRKPALNRYRCDECRRKHNDRQTFYNRFHGYVRQYSDDYYRAKSEREVVSWCWRNPA